MRDGGYMAKTKRVVEKEACCLSCAYAQMGFNLYDCLLKNITVNALHCCPSWTRTIIVEEDTDLMDWDGKNF